MDNSNKFKFIVLQLPHEVQDLIIQHSIRASSYQTLIDFILDYPVSISEYLSPPMEVESLSNSYTLKIQTTITKQVKGSRINSKTSIMFLKYVIEMFNYTMDYGTLCMNIKNTDIRMRSVTMQSRDGNNLLKSLKIAKIRNLKLSIDHPPGLQDAMKIMKFANEISLDNRQALEFYTRNNLMFPEMILNISMQLSVSNVIDILKSKKFKNLKAINVSIYDKEINEDMIKSLTELINLSPTNLIFNCHVTYPSLSELTFLNDYNIGSSTLKLLSDFHNEYKHRSNLSYEVFLFFVDSGHKFTKFIDCNKVHQLYVCHPGPNTTDFKKLDWNKFNGLKQMHVKVLHLYIGYLIDCLPSSLQKIKLNFGSFRTDINENNWKVPPSIIELEIDTFPTGEGPMESLLSSIDWSESQVKKLCLCWNKVFDARGHLILLVKSLPNTLELLDISGCGYEVVLICDEIPSFIEESDNAKKIYYSGEYGSVIINKGELQYRLTWMGKA